MKMRMCRSSKQRIIIVTVVSSFISELLIIIYCPSSFDEVRCVGNGVLGNHMVGLGCCVFDVHSNTSSEA